MSLSVQSTALIQYLEKRDKTYAAKVLELREAVAHWLEYIPQTFPRYTQHTVEHSDEIVIQLSKLLFEHDNSDKPVINLTAMETYVLIACAYLHDAGMVCSDEEKERILSDDGWRQWIGSSAADRWKQIEDFRNGAVPAEPQVRDFIADMQTREMIAEFVRRMHHRRSADVIRNQSALGRFAFDDPQLQDTIAEICVAHGLDRKELEDPIAYPTLRQLRGENVNVRLLAVLLRLGDLLDLRVTRACPMLFNAAGPIGPSSLPHWMQNQRIKSFAVSPTAITIRAECQSMDEHRILRDWCQWIVDEVAEARGLLAESGPHTDWRPPRASLTGDNATIHIMPAKGANYIVHDWRFELDATSIFQRLISDLYSDPYAFLRELIQNALDAMRCRLFEDLRSRGLGLPEKPTEVSEDIRRNYVLRIEARKVEVRNELTGKEETITAIVVDDCGIGMGEEVIQRHFLQVGRSYYETEQFRRAYTFVPASRFGVGFLSVFAASDDVFVDSLKFDSPPSSDGIQLRLTGPRKYIAVAKSSRRKPGTRIEVRLRPSLELKPGMLTKIIGDWCKRVEFPIEITDFGTRSMVMSEKPQDFVFEVPDAEQPGATFSMRSFPIRDRELDGELYVLIYKSKGGCEDWSREKWYTYRYRTIHPEAEIRPLPTSLRCLHGITLFEESYTLSGGKARIDYRGKRTRPDLSRASVLRTRGSDREVDEILAKRWREILDQHMSSCELAKGVSGWKYRNRLADLFERNTGAEYWNDTAGMIPLFVCGEERAVSLTALARLPVITEVLPAVSQTCFSGGKRTGSKSDAPRVPAAAARLPAIISFGDLSHFADLVLRELFNKRSPARCRWLDRSSFAIDWELNGPEPARSDSFAAHFGCDFPSKERAALFLDQPHPMPDVLLVNRSNPLGNWYLEICKNIGATETVHELGSVIQEAARYCFHIGKQHELLRQHLAGWTAMKDLPEDLKPPSFEITAETFTWPYSDTESSLAEPES